MAFPDISSAIWTLHERPHEFFMRNGWLEQTGGLYRYKLDQFGLVFVQAGDSGPCRLIVGDEARELICAFEGWRRDYGISSAVSRAFGPRLRRPGLWRRFQYWLECRLPEHRGESALAIYAQAFASNRPPDRDPGPEPPPGHSRVPRPPAPDRGNANIPRMMHDRPLQSEPSGGITGRSAIERGTTPLRK